MNGYGLFRVMTKSRPEIIIEGSADGNEWLPYEFRWKPGALERAPRWVAPHQPRLDWQMWFAALGNYRQNPWFVSLLERLLRNTPAVTRLLERNPFPETPPRYIRARLYEYRFTTWAEHRATGNWWKREESGEYLPAISLENFDRRLIHQAQPLRGSVCGAVFTSPGTGLCSSCLKTGSSAQPARSANTISSRTRRAIDEDFVEP